MSRLIFSLLCLLTFSLALPYSGGNPFVEKFVNAASRHFEAKEYSDALEDIKQALERDDQHLGALELWANISETTNDNDTTAYALHTWLNIVESSEENLVPRKKIKEVEKRLEEIDPFAKTFNKLSSDYLKELFKIEKAHSEKGRFHSALKVLEEILHISPSLNRGKQRVKEIQRLGGADVATVDLYAGTDPTSGVDSEWIADHDLRHKEWAQRARKETEHYRINTNAGYLILQTAAIAMDQMNLAYRKFFKYKEDGGAVPKIDVNVFKSRDEYLKLGKGPPVEWSGGHFTGDAVETYVEGEQGKSSLQGMYETLFHEAAHQFVSLTGKGGVPGWLNEAYASFFEGTDILSNGTVRWNRVNSGRLFAVAPRMEEGWMADHTDGVRDEQGEWASPSRAPSLRILIENEYQWGPPWYAPTWGVVYFLYNYRDPETGRAVLRIPLHNYYLSGAAHKGLSQRVEHFEEMVLSGPDAPVKTVDELNEIWKEWILKLRDQTIGKESPETTLLAYADKALANNEIDLAQELLEEALLYAPDDVEALWEMARLMQELEEDDRAASYYGKFANEMSLRGVNEDPRIEEAKKLMNELDPMFKKHKRLQVKLEESGLELAKQYYDLKMYRMAMEITRRMSASWSMPGALDFYTKVARETGISLSRWKVAYNEMSLDGWQKNDAYRAYGKMIQVNVVNNPDIEMVGDENLQTQPLIYDISFDSDFSLEAEFRFHNQSPAMLGLCFGLKDSKNTQVVVLHRKGSLEVKTQFGGSWIPRDKQQIPLTDDWHKLRIDVVTQEGPKAVVDIYFDDKYLRTIKMSREAVRGSFGLFTTTGKGEYRNIRMLARDAHDPASRIERELKLQARINNPEARTPGVFQGLKPPKLSELEGKLLQGKEVNLASRAGSITVIAFWTPLQDELIPTSDYYSMLAEKYRKYNIQLICIAGNENTEQQVRDWIAQHPLNGVSLLWDEKYKIYPTYNVVPGGWSLPRILVLDVDGLVYWEGDPNLPLNKGWDKNNPSKTPLDTVIEELMAERSIREIMQHAEKVLLAEKEFESQEWRKALNLIEPLIKLEANYSPIVRRAKSLRDAIEAEGTALPLAAENLINNGYPLAAQKILEKLVTEFPGTSLVDDLGAPRKRKLERSSLYRDARSQMRKIEKATQRIEAGDRTEALKLLEQVEEDKPCVEILEQVQATKKRLNL